MAKNIIKINEMFARGWRDTKDNKNKRKLHKTNNVLKLNNNIFALPPTKTTEQLNKVFKLTGKKTRGQVQKFRGISVRN